MAHRYRREHLQTVADFLSRDDTVCVSHPDIIIICRNANHHAALLCRFAELIKDEAAPDQPKDDPIFPEF